MRSARKSTYLSYLTGPPNPCPFHSSPGQARGKKNCRPSTIIIILSPYFPHCTASGFCFFEPLPSRPYPCQVKWHPPPPSPGAASHPLLQAVPHFLVISRPPSASSRPAQGPDSPGLVRRALTWSSVYRQGQDPSLILSLEMLCCPWIPWAPFPNNEPHLTVSALLWASFLPSFFCSIPSRPIAQNVPLISLY